MARGRLSRRRAVSRTTSSRSNRVSIKSFVTRTKGQRAEMHRERRQPGTAAIIARILSRGLSLSPADPHTRGPRCTFPSPCSSELRESSVAIRGHSLRKSIREATRSLVAFHLETRDRFPLLFNSERVSLLHVGADRRPGSPSILRKRPERSRARPANATVFDPRTFYSLLPRARGAERSYPIARNRRNALTLIHLINRPLSACN